MPTLALNPFEWTLRKMPVVELIIHNQRRFFLVDTGATTTGLHGDLLSEFKTSWHLVNVHGFNGKNHVELYSIKFRALGKTLTEVLKLPMTSLSIDGVLGADLIGQFDQVIFDFKENKVRFVP